jgi:hypothetical protein
LPAFYVDGIDKQMSSLSLRSGRTARGNDDQHKGAKEEDAGTEPAAQVLHADGRGA